MRVSKSMADGHTGAMLQVFYLRVKKIRVINCFPTPVDNFTRTAHALRTGVRTYKTAGQKPMPQMIRRPVVKRRQENWGKLSKERHERKPDKKDGETGICSLAQVVR